MSPAFTPFEFDSDTRNYHVSYHTSITGGTSCSAGCRFYNCEITYTVAGPQ